MGQMDTLNVELGERSYPIHIGPGALTTPELVRPALDGRRVAVVTNSTIAPLHGAALGRTLARCDTGGEPLWIELPDGEQHKTMATVETILTRLLEARFDRGGRIVALGGGVVGDIAGFAAAIYQRGIDFVQVPTTLLAQVDSSVGGKTGVNHPLGKNMIGAFHQPRAVVIDTDTLNTLPDRELQAGLAEVIKYGLIQDADFFAWLEEHVDALRSLDPDALAYAIRRSCACKADIVAADERESGQRALLNLGHTFGHAIETDQGYGEWLHGEAVAAGMVLAARLSAARGWLPAAAVDELAAFLRRVGLPVAPPPAMDAARCLALMARDKKVMDGRLRLILLRRLGEAVIIDDVADAEIEALLAG